MLKSSFGEVTPPPSHMFEHVFLKEDADVFMDAEMTRSIREREFGAM